MIFGDCWRIFKVSDGAWQAISCFLCHDSLARRDGDSSYFYSILSSDLLSFFGSERTVRERAAVMMGEGDTEINIAEISSSQLDPRQLQKVHKLVDGLGITFRDDDEYDSTETGWIVRRQVPWNAISRSAIV
jgi:hypothetical protein